VGFKVREIAYNNAISADLSDKYRLMKGEILPVVFKD
jgi:hypothetical protein